VRWVRVAHMFDNDYPKGSYRGRSPGRACPVESHIPDRRRVSTVGGPQIRESRPIRPGRHEPPPASPRGKARPGSGWERSCAPAQRCRRPDRLRPVPHDLATAARRIRPPIAAPAGQVPRSAADPAPPGQPRPSQVQRTLWHGKARVGERTGANRSESERPCAPAARCRGPPAEGRAVPCGMSTPAVEEGIMALMPEDAKAALLLLARQLPYEVTQALDRIEGRRS